MAETNTPLVHDVIDSGEAAIHRTVDLISEFGQGTGSVAQNVNQHLVTIESGLLQKLTEGGQLTISETGDLIKDLTSSLADAVKTVI